MLFNQRIINTAAELNFCLAICRVIKVGYISSLIAILLFSTHLYFQTLSLENVIILSLTCSIILALVNALSHIKDITIREHTAEMINEKPIEASIWELYKNDAPSVVDSMNS